MILQRLKAIVFMNKGNGGPPDLDEVWRELTDKLKASLGQNKKSDTSQKKGEGGGKGNFDSNYDKQTREGFPRIGWVILIGALLVWLASGFYIVDESQRGIVMRFGAYQEETLPGLRWRLPYPIEKHIVVNLTGIRTVEIGYRGSEANKEPKESLMLTDDENIVNIQFAIQFYLKSPKDFVFNNQSTDERIRGEDWVRQVAETAIREVVGRSRMDYVLYEGREQIAAQTKVLMQQILDRYQTGIQISRVTMQNAQPPEKVQAAFVDAVKAGQDRERQKNEGQAYANDVIPRARGTEARLLAEAAAYRSQVVAMAEGDAARFDQVLKEYNRAPAVTRQRIYIDTMQDIMKNMTKVLVDSKSNGQMLYLPLDRLMGQQQLPAPIQQILPQTQAPTAGATVNPSAIGTSDGNTRPGRGERP